MAPPATFLYFQVLLNHFSADFNIETHFGLGNLGTSVFLRFKIIQFKIESIFKMATSQLTIHRLNLVFSPISNLQSSIHIENFMRINDTFWFFDSLSISSEIELGLPSQIKIFLIVSSLFEDFSNLF
jgi:hypothetical protein